MQTTKEQREELRREIAYQRSMDNGYYQDSTLRLDLLADLLSDLDRMEEVEKALRKTYDFMYCTRCYNPEADYGEQRECGEECGCECHSVHSLVQSALGEKP